MPEDLPVARELAGIVAEELMTSVRPSLSGRPAFEVAMAANLLGIVARELELGPAARAAEHERLRALTGRDAGLAELEQELVQRIRDGIAPGDPRERVLAHLRATAADRVAIVNPGYLRGSD